MKIKIVRSSNWRMIKFLVLINFNGFLERHHNTCNYNFKNDVNSTVQLNKEENVRFETYFHVTKLYNNNYNTVRAVDRFVSTLPEASILF